MQGLKEQCCLLEIMLLHYKDFNIEPGVIIDMVQFMQQTGYGSHQPLRLGPAAQDYIKYIKSVHYLSNIA